jgi:hypothetical protein
MKPVFVTDLDGTLLRPDATLSDDSAKTLNQALSLGYIVTYATARSWTSSMKAVSAVQWKYPVILYNGALIFDPLRKKVIDGHWLARAKTNELICLGKGLGFTPLYFALDEGDREVVLHEELSRTGDVEFYRSRPGDPRFRQVDALICPDGYKTLGLTYIGLHEELKQLRDKAAQRYADEVHIHFAKDGYLSDQYFLEFSHPKANKREGLRLFAQMAGVEPGEITVFGDNLNDTGMFEIAGRRVAVSNAHPELKKLSSHVIASNDCDSVAKYIANLIP